MVNINIQFKKKDLFLVLAIGIFVIGMGFVVAWNSVPANPAVMGHTADEIDGLIDLIDDRIANSFTQEVGDCSSPTLIFSSSNLPEISGYHKMPTGDYSLGVKAVPAKCISSPCKLKQEVYYLGNPKSTSYYEYAQDASGGWKCSSLSGKNGDTIGSKVIPSINYIYLYDDFSGSSGETSINQWTFRDSSNGYDMNVYVC